MNSRKTTPEAHINVGAKKANGPQFIVLEGLDGTGKSTVAKLVAQGLPARQMSTPPAKLGNMREELNYLFADFGRARHLFYAATVSWAAEILQETLKKGISVVMDRYWPSTKVYAGLYGSDLLLNEIQQILPRPNITVFLDADDRIRSQRIQCRGASPDDPISLEKSALLRKLYNQALDSSWCGRVIRLDASIATPEVLATRIISFARGDG